MKLLFSFLLMLLSVVSYSQYKEYLIKHNGDTLYGNIELTNSTFFINSLRSHPIALNAKEVKKVHSENFKGSIVVPCILHTYTDDLTELMRYEYFNQDIATVMILKELYNSPKINLYWGMDDLKRQYYFYKTPSDELPVQLYVNYALGGGNSAHFTNINVWGEESLTHLEIQKGYVNQLRFIMRDCTDIPESTWELLDYRDYSLKNVLKKFNDCTATD